MTANIHRRPADDGWTYTEVLNDDGSVAYWEYTKDVMVRVRPTDVIKPFEVVGPEHFGLPENWGWADLVAWQKRKNQ